MGESVLSVVGLLASCGEHEVPRTSGRPPPAAAHQPHHHLALHRAQLGRARLRLPVQQVGEEPGQEDGEDHRPRPGWHQLDDEEDGLDEGDVVVVVVFS